MKTWFHTKTERFSFWTAAILQCMWMLGKQILNSPHREMWPADTGIVSVFATGGLFLFFLILIPFVTGSIVFAIVSAIQHFLLSMRSYRPNSE